VSAAALTGLQPIAAAAAGGGEPIAATAAGERVQQLHTLLEQVEQGPSVGSSKTFASALGAARAELPTTSGYPAELPTTGGYPAVAPSADLPTAGGYPAATPTTVAYDSAAPVGASAGGAGSAYAPMIEQAAARYGIDPSLLYGLIQQESGFDPSASSSAGAQGLTQLMPSTAASLGVSEPLDPAQSIEGGARYLSGLLNQFGGNTADALAAYNAGPGAVEQYGGVPPYPETQQYVAKVLGYAASYSPSGQATGTAALASATTPTAGAATTAEAIV
jgi:soluble lytic murein transglycosylase-like protein